MVALGLAIFLHFIESGISWCADSIAGTPPLVVWKTWC